ncbi:DUF3152 domain-containing protein [Nakamurella panacisegetis]|uniref:DUF3152 domain-containing protein n=1 Tax=Nakamurella panacisegetis TaxID=1090615 RepID=UPI000B89D9CF|nr:DUF3152 domain-containing protein [Nakamurella panacisegetis]
MGRSTLWDDPEGGRPGPQPLKASWDPVDRGPRTPSKPRPSRTGRRRSAVGWFFHRYGWRAYAIPVLVALTVLVIVQVGRPPTSTAAPSVPGASPSLVTSVVGSVTTTMTVTAAPTSTPSGPAAAAGGASPSASSPNVSGQVGPVPTGTYAGLASADLPPGEAFVAKGKGTWHVVAGTTKPFGSGPNHFTYKIAVEDGIENSDADKDFASFVDATLQDPRSWIGSGKYTLQRIDTGTPSFTVSLTSQMTVRQDSLCGWQIQYEASCYARDVKRVAINNARWARGAVSYAGDRADYRVYAINHEVGHALGFMHQPCATNGGLAPVMMQQSWSTADDDLSPLNPQLVPMDNKVCKPNPFPFPLGPVSGSSTATAQATATRSGG